MKTKTVRFKITLWFSASLIIVVALAFISFMVVSSMVVERTTTNVLRDAVEQNMDEVEFHSEKLYDEADYDADYYLKYKDGWLEIDDDFIPEVNGVLCSVYDRVKNEIIYGENPIAADTKTLEFDNKKLQKIEVDGIKYYVFDRKVKNKGIDDIWIRGVISGEHNAGDITDISRFTVIILIIILIVAIFGGNAVAGRVLNPISQITEAASRISKGNDLKKRLDIGTGNDEIHQLADTFNEMVARLDQAFENEQQFTSDVSHELRTPISVIMAQSEFALDNGKTNEDYIEALESIRRQSVKMNRLVNDMLTFARLGKEKSVYIKEDLNISELSRMVSEDMALIGEKEISLESHIEPDIYVKGNEELMTRLLSNLISNGYKYGKEDGHISVDLTVNGEYAVLSVTDDGIGIPETDLHKVFNRFYQVDSSRTDKGSGLGLYMAREIAQFHEGELTVESSLGMGSRFILKIKKL